MTEFDYKMFGEVSETIRENVELEYKVKELEKELENRIKIDDIKGFFNVYGDEKAGYSIYINEDNKKDILELLGVETKGELNENI